MFYTRLQQLCEAHGTNVTNMLKDLGLSTGCTGNWKKGQIPKGDILLKISEYLDTSIDYIITGKYRDDLDSDERRLVAIYRSVPEKARYKILCDFENIAALEKARLNAE